MGAALEPTPSVEQPLAVIDEVDQRLAELKARVESLANLLHASTQRANDAEQQVQLLREEITIAHSVNERQRDALDLAQRRHLDLKDHVANLRQGLGGTTDPTDFLRSLADAEQLRNLALAENAMLLERLQVAEGDSATGKARTNDLAAQVAALIAELAELNALESERLRGSSPVAWWK